MDCGLFALYFACARYEKHLRVKSLNVKIFCVWRTSVHAIPFSFVMRSTAFNEHIKLLQVSYVPPICFQLSFPIDHCFFVISAREEVPSRASQFLWCKRFAFLCTRAIWFRLCTSHSRELIALDSSICDGTNAVSQYIYYFLLERSWILKSAIRNQSQVFARLDGDLSNRSGQSYQFWYFGNQSKSLPSGTWGRYERSPVST